MQEVIVFSLCKNNLQLYFNPRCCKIMSKMSFQSLNRWNMGNLYLQKNLHFFSKTSLVVCISRSDKVIYLIQKIKP